MTRPARFLSTAMLLMTIALLSPAPSTAAPRSSATAAPGTTPTQSTKPSLAQQAKPKPPSKPAPAPLPPLDAAPPSPAPAIPERIEVDVSTRTIEVTSAFSGTEIIVFGTVINSQQESAESGYYDVVVVVEGRGATSIVRLKSNVGGLWVNTQSIRFDNLPLYSAIASSRPLEEIADPSVFVANVIGFTRARMVPGRHSSNVTPAELDAYKTAALRLKEKDGLYVTADYGVAFIGPALFRASIKLPANIPVGPLSARVFLFHDGQLLASQKSSVMLERQGIDRLVYDFAFEHPVWYGILAVAIAASAGLAASLAVGRSAR